DGRLFDDDREAALRDGHGREPNVASGDDGAGTFVQDDARRVRRLNLDVPYRGDELDGVTVELGRRLDLDGATVERGRRSVAERLVDGFDDPLGGDKI